MQRYGHQREHVPKESILNQNWLLTATEKTGVMPPKQMAIDGTLPIKL